MGINFDAIIKSAEKELNASIIKMEALYQEFLSATTEFIKSWYWDETTLMVKRKPEITKGLVTERLSGMKTELGLLRDYCDNFTLEFLNVDNLWWHKNHANQISDNSGNPGSEDLDKSVRFIAGKLALLLEKYGYLSNKSQGPDVWREWDNTGNLKNLQGRQYYPDPLEWSDAMKGIIAKYRALQQVGSKQASKLDTLKKAKEMQEAEDLWKQA